MREHGEAGQWYEPFHPSVNGVVEVPLLLSVEQLSALEAAAHTRGLTTGEMLRQLLHDFVAVGPSHRCAC
jgi:hypothetical protein